MGNRKKKQHSKSAKTPPQKVYPVALLDQSTAKRIRTSAERKLRNAQASFSGVTVEREEFFSIHVPAYDEWLRANFSKETSLLNDLNQSLVEKQQELQRLRIGLLFGARGVGDSSEIEDRDDDPDFQFGEGNPSDEAEDNPLDDEEQFEAFLVDVFEEMTGRNPFTNDKTRKLFDQFREEMRSKKSFHSGGSASSRSSANAAGDSSNTELKYYYRILVRRLHPDVVAKKTKTPFESDLWNQVQSAYGRKDVALLKQLFALALLTDKEQSVHLPIGDVLGAVEHCKQRTKLARKELRSLKKAPSWAFGSKSEIEKKHFYRACKAEWREAMADLKEGLEHVEHYIQVLKGESTPSRKSGGGKK